MKNNKPPRFNTLSYLSSEALNIKAETSLWLAPVAFGALLLILSVLLLIQSLPSPNTLILFLPLVWVLVGLFAASFGAKATQNENTLSLYLFSPLSFPTLYRLQLALQSLFLIIPLSFLCVIATFLIPLPLCTLWPQILLLALSLPSLLMLGQLIQSLQGRNNPLLLFFLSLPLTLPILLLTGFCLELSLAEENSLPFYALLLAIQWGLWLVTPHALLFNRKVLM